MRRDSEVASSCRIERKRAHDREAQRASRAKTKAYISHLEKTVADLTEGSGDTRANYLAQHASQQTQEIDKLQSLVSKIRTLVHEAGGKIHDQESNSPGLKNEGNTSSAESAATTTGPVEAQSNTWEDSPSPEQDVWPASESTYKKAIDREADDAEPAPEQTTLTKPQTTSSSRRSLTVLGISLHCNPTEDTSYFVRLNNLIQTLETSTPDNLSTYDTDVDILVRALTRSWDEAERHHHFDIVWRFLRAFDEGLWEQHSGVVERFAHTWNMRCTMLHRIMPKNQERRRMAGFMHPAPSLKDGSGAARKHPPVIDYFGWPQVRRQLLSQGIHRCSGKASIAFAQNFRFVWPWEVRDVYKVNRATGLFSLSEAFLRSWNDLSCYRMLQNSLVPFWVHPGQGIAMGIPARERNVEGDEEMSPVDAVVAQTEQVVSLEASAEEWMSSFNMALTEEAGMLGLGSYSNPFSGSHVESSVTQWPIA